MFEYHVVDGYTFITGYPDGSEWMIEGSGTQGLLDTDPTVHWRIGHDDRVEYRSLTDRRIIRELPLDLPEPKEIALTASGPGRLYILARLPEAQNEPRVGELILVDLANAAILGRRKGVSLDRDGAVMPDGALILSRIDSVGGEVGEMLIRADPADLSLQQSFLPYPRRDGNRMANHWLFHSPDGRWWLRFDPTSFPIAEHSPTPGAAPRRYYGVTLQCWSAFPLKFERRIVVAWLKAEDLPDETHILQLWRSEAATPSPRPGFLSRLFGSNGANGASAITPRKQALLDSVPERDRIYTAISQALHRPDAAPDAPWPDRSAFGEAAADDKLWDAINKNIDTLVRHTLWRSAGWQPDNEALWIDRLGFLICVGMDGTVSPQIWTERFGLDENSVRPSANSSGVPVPLPDRKLAACKRPSSAIATLPAVEGGRLIVEGRPVEPRFEPAMLPKKSDQWVAGTAALTPRFTEQERWSREVTQIKEQGAKVRIPVDGSRDAAIRKLGDRFDGALFNRAYDHILDIAFVENGEEVPEGEFFSAIGPADRLWAPASLRYLIERYLGAYKAQPSSETFYQPDEFDVEAGVPAILAEAVLRLAQLDLTALPLIRAYGGTIDGGHEYYFAGVIIPAVYETHGYTSEVVDFLCWAALANFYNSADAPAVWKDYGLRDALVRMAPEEAAARMVRVGQQQPMDREDAFGAIGMIRRNAGEDGPWDRAFFAAIERLVPGSTSND